MAPVEDPPSLKLRRDKPIRPEYDRSRAGLAAQLFSYHCSYQIFFFQIIIRSMSKLQSRGGGTQSKLWALAKY
jgi:hypothetical protein